MDFSFRTSPKTSLAWSPLSRSLRHGTALRRCRRTAVKNEAGDAGGTDGEDAGRRDDPPAMSDAWLCV